MIDDVRALGAVQVCGDAEFVAEHFHRRRIVARKGGTAGDIEQQPGAACLQHRILVAGEGETGAQRHGIMVALTPGDAEHHVAAAGHLGHRRLGPGEDVADRGAALLVRRGLPIREPADEDRLAQRMRGVAGGLAEGRLAGKGRGEAGEQESGWTHAGRDTARRRGKQAQRARRPATVDRALRRLMAQRVAKQGACHPHDGSHRDDARRKHCRPP
jgi:hypothetical protein